MKSSLADTGVGSTCRSKRCKWPKPGTLSFEFNGRQMVVKSPWTQKDDESVIGGWGKNPSAGKINRETCLS